MGGDILIDSNLKEKYEQIYSENTIKLFEFLRRQKTRDILIDYDSLKEEVGFRREEYPEFDKFKNDVLSPALLKLKSLGMVEGTYKKKDRIIHFSIRYTM